VIRNTSIVAAATRLLWSSFKMKKPDTIQHRNTTGAVMMWKPYNTASYTFCPSIPIRLTIWKETEVQISNQSI